MLSLAALGRIGASTTPYPVVEEDQVLTGLEPAPATGNPLDGFVLHDAALQPLRLAYRDDAAGLWLYQGDCLEILDALNLRYPAGRFDAIFTYLAFIPSASKLHHAWLERCQRALAPHGTLWVAGPAPSLLPLQQLMAQLGYKVFCPVPSKEDAASGLPAVLRAAKHSRSKHISHGAVGKSRHPYSTPKTASLAERCLLASTNPDDLVLDPFLGSGTTAIAAFRTGRKCVGIELDAGSLEMAKKRLSNAR